MSENLNLEEIEQKVLEDLRADPHYAKSMVLFREWARCVARNDTDEIWQVAQKYVALANEFSLYIRALRREIVSLRQDIERLERDE